MIYVFKTAIKTEKTVKQLTAELNLLLPQAEWNFDLDDCDNIFRVETSRADTKDLILAFMKEKNFFCEELRD